MVLLSTKEKENLVIELLNKGYNLREIAKKAHVSFTDIGKIRKKILGEEIVDDKQKEEGCIIKSLSAPSQAFQLFLENKTLVEVAIILDISKDEIMQIYCDFLILKNMRQVVAILQEYRTNLSSFLKLFNYLKKNNVKWKDIKIAIDNKNKINSLEKQKEKLEKEIELFIEERGYLLKNQKY